MKFHVACFISIILLYTVDSGVSDSLSQSIAQFSIDAYRQLGKVNSNDNFIFSPTNIYHLLLLTYFGSSGNTASELASSLHAKDFEESDLRESARSVFESLVSTNSRKFQLSTAVAVFSQVGHELESKFLQTAETHFRANVTSVDFMRKFESIRGDINQWVEEKTNNKIKNLLEPGVLNSETMLVLVNAIYFKGDWAKKFDPQDTYHGVFHNIDGSESTVDMMFLSSKLRAGFLEEYNAEVLELPYADGELSMLIFLPDQESSSLDVLQSSLTAQHLVNITDELDEIKVDVILPKFKVEFSTSLNDILSAMGINDLFIEGKADLSKIFGQKELHVSATVHKAFVEVWEEGSEATASTAAVIQKRSIRHTFMTDRPFSFCVFSNNNRLPVFMGRLAWIDSLIKDEL